jgi:hypothetical protein
MKCETGSTGALNSARIPSWEVDAVVSLEQDDDIVICNANGRSHAVRWTLPSNALVLVSGIRIELLADVPQRRIFEYICPEVVFGPHCTLLG